MYPEIDPRYYYRQTRQKNLNRSTNQQSRKRRSSNEPDNVLGTRRETGYHDDVYRQSIIDKKVKETIPKTISRFMLVSYKEIEEDLEKLSYSKNEYNYLSALDELIQSKKIYLVNQKPDVFALQPEVATDKLNRYLIYLQELKLKNTIKNAPKNANKKFRDDINKYTDAIAQLENGLNNLINDNQINSLKNSSLPKKQQPLSSKEKTIDKPIKNSCSSIQNDLNNQKPIVQCDQITSTNETNSLKGNLEPNNEDEENCKEESIKDLPNKIVISNMVAPKSGDKQKAKRRKARRIRKATKNNEKNATESDKNLKNKEDPHPIKRQQKKFEKTNIIQDKIISSSTDKRSNDEKFKGSENLKYENSSQISSSSTSSDSEESIEILPDSEIYPSEDIYQKISDAGFDYESIITRFANWNRSPISALNEFGQIVHISVKLEITDSTGPDHAKLFQATAFLDKKKLSVAWGKSKKRAKGCASELAIRAITASLPSERCDLNIEKYHNHFDQLAVLSYSKFNDLLVLVPNYVNFGRKIVATVLMKTPTDQYGQAIAVGTGNRCVSGEYLVTNGRVIFDSHAEVIARRSFLNFLMKQIEFYKTGEKESIFEKDTESDLLVLKEGYTFHLYISTAPCGDGALFTHSSKQNCLTELETDNHEPLFETFLHGRLRTKMESGEGTISLDENYSSPELDQILRGERLRTMSCSDKICRWNLLGFQGCLLLHFIKPIYLNSISLGALYHNGHLSRACCCRLEKDYFTEILEKPNNVFKINHPALGCPTSFKFPREPVKTKSDSLNWSLYEESPELTNGNTGLKFNMEESRICKYELFKRFKHLCSLFQKEDLNELTYYEVKAKVEDYNELKKTFFDFLKYKKYGPWVCKPLETKVFK